MTDRPFIVLVCGGRNNRDPRAIDAALRPLLDEHGHLLEIIHGGCEGIDADTNRSTKRPPSKETDQ